MRLSIFVLVACGGSGGQEPILGTPSVTSAPRVILTTPAKLNRDMLASTAPKPRTLFGMLAVLHALRTAAPWVGTIIANAGVTISTAGQTIQTTLTGRAIGLNASVSTVNTTILTP